MESQIIDAYKEMLVSGEQDITTYTLAKRVGITEKEFFQYFNSADDVGRHIWLNLGEEVMEALNNSELYNSYPPRQKLLSYFFTFFELAVNERTFIKHTWQRPEVTKKYREAFESYMSDIIQEGIATEDIKERLSLSNYYPKALWTLHSRLLNFWMHDTSDKFVQTEKAIEVYSRLPLELMGPNLFDSIYESVRFEVQQFSFDKFKIFG